MCEKDHSGHKTVTYGSIMPDINKANSELNNMKNNIEKTKEYINNIIIQLKNYINNIDIYYKISNDIIKNYENKKRNYPVLQNINDIITFINDFNNNISDINIENTIKNTINDIISSTIVQINLSKEKNIIKNENKELEGNVDKKEEKEEEEENEDNNISEYNKYDPSKDFYLNFKINSLREENKFETQYETERLIILHDKRILTYQKYQKGDSYFSYNYRMFVYNPNNNFNCDFSFDVGKSYDMFLMNDGNVVFMDIIDKKIKVFKLKKNLTKFCKK